MKIEIRGDADHLRHLTWKLKEKFDGVEFDTGWMEVLIVKVFSVHRESIQLYIEAFCAGAGLTWKVTQ
jgi:hypothetical protein